METDIDYSKVERKKIEDIIEFLKKDNIIFKFNKWIFEQFSTDTLIEEMYLIRDKDSRLSARKRKIIKLLDMRLSQLVITLGEDN